MNSKDFWKGFRKGFKAFGQGVTLVVNTLLLLIVYIFGVGITSVIARLAGKKFMDMELQKGAKTYWTELNLKKKPIEEYYRQF